MSEKVKEDNQILDIKTAKELLRTSPRKVVIVRLEDGLVVDMRLHAVREPGQNGEKEQFKSAREGFKQAWKEAMTGETLQLSELWTDIDPND